MGVTFTPSDNVNYKAVSNIFASVQVATQTPNLAVLPQAKNYNLGDAWDPAILLVGGSVADIYSGQLVTGVFSFMNDAPSNVGVYTADILFTPTLSGNYSVITASVLMTVLAPISNVEASGGETMIRVTWIDPNPVGVVAGYYVYVNGTRSTPLLTNPEILLTGLSSSSSYTIGVVVIAVNGGQPHAAKEVEATMGLQSDAVLLRATVLGLTFTLTTLSLRVYRSVFKLSSMATVNASGWARQATIAAVGGTSVMIGLSQGIDPYFVGFVFGADGRLMETGFLQTIFLQEKLRWSKFYVNYVENDLTTSPLLDTRGKMVILSKKQGTSSLVIKTYNNPHHELFLNLAQVR
jgi:hypothetical protein